MIKEVTKESLELWNEMYDYNKSEFNTPEKFTERASEIKIKVKHTPGSVKSYNPEIPEDKLVTLDVQEVTDYVTGRIYDKEFYKQMENNK